MKRQKWNNFQLSYPVTMDTYASCWYGSVWVQWIFLFYFEGVCVYADETLFESSNKHIKIIITCTAELWYFNRSFQVDAFNKFVTQ